MSNVVMIALTTIIALGTLSTVASARTCEQLRSLCYTMRDDKNDCAGPYRRCLKTGVFITPLGRRFQATR